eukprot:scaffold2859_cov349-Pavlova_lutheri.AAC.29
MSDGMPADETEQFEDDAERDGGEGDSSNEKDSSSEEDGDFQASQEDTEGDEDESEEDDSEDEDFVVGAAKKRQKIRSQAEKNVKAPGKANSEKAYIEETESEELIGEGPSGSDSREKGALRTHRQTPASSRMYAEEDGSSLSEDEEERRRREKKAFQSLPIAYQYPDGPDSDEIEKVLDHRWDGGGEEGEDGVSEDSWEERSYLIKWRGRSHIHNSWEPYSYLAELPGLKRVQNYIKKHRELEDAQAWMTREEQEMKNVEIEMEKELANEHTKVDRIVEEKVEGDRVRYLCKWKGLPYSECTWEDRADISASLNEIDDYHDRMQRLRSTCKGMDAQRQAFLRHKNQALREQPPYLTGGQLRDYQLDGLNWLIYAWAHGNNGILADEMGLGKTIQCVSMLAWLQETQKVPGPFLVIVPLSTITNWAKEFQKWTPTLNLVVYVGDGASRQLIQDYEFYTGRKAGRMYRFSVLLTTFEMSLKDARVLNSIKWNYLMVDEAHRLKNCDSSLYRVLETYTFRSILLVTGTPLQNNLRELWCLLHFIDPKKFDSLEDFEEDYHLDDPKSIEALHTVMRPHVLRRVIKDVERSLPPKTERILRVEMSPLQRRYYLWILKKNFNELNKGVKGPQLSLLNTVVDLKKCCNHPFLFESAEVEYAGDKDNEGQDALGRLVLSSGKLNLLDKLLTRLKQTGHRVLIFSQMVRMLDILSDYLRLKGYQHQRLDGSTGSVARHQAMDHFNTEGSDDFVFLLSTRAGGLGLNLATADTVVIFDSDWNPQNDLQAMSRAHRIGQKDSVNIYRLITSGSVEEDILERAKQKMVLDHLIIQRMDASGRSVLKRESSSKAIFKKDELAAILRFGAEELFKEEEANKGVSESKGAQVDLDAILERAEHVNTREQGGEDLLNAFKVANFASTEDDQTFWSRLIPESDRPKAEKEQVDLLPRNALKIIQSQEAELKNSRKRERPGPTQRTTSGSASKKNSTGEPGPPVPGAVERLDKFPQDAASSLKCLSKLQAEKVVKAVNRHGTLGRVVHMLKSEPVFQLTEEKDLEAAWALLVDSCRRIQSDAGQDSSSPILDFFGVSTKVLDTVSRVDEQQCLARHVERFADPLQFRLGGGIHLKLPVWASSCGWTTRDDAMLLLGIYYHGFGRWEDIRVDSQLGLEMKMAPPASQAQDDSKHLPKSPQLRARVMALLKKLMDAGSGFPSKAGTKPAKDRAASGSRARKSSNTPKVPLKLSTQRVAKLMEGVHGVLKKLRALQHRDDIPNEVVKEKIKKYIVQVGTHIDLLSGGIDPASIPQLWSHVSSYSSLSGDRLASIYSRLKALPTDGPRS